jgi:hypothetical protein
MYYDIFLLVTDASSVTIEWASRTGASVANETIT